MSGSENTQNQKILEVVALALAEKGSEHYMLARRGPSGSGAGEWEFPGGKIETGETQIQALRREIQEELSFDLQDLQLEFVASHLQHYPQRSIRIHLWRAEVTKRPEFRLCDHDKVDWFTLEQMNEISLSQGDKAFIIQLYSNIR